MVGFKFDSGAGLAPTGRCPGDSTFACRAWHGQTSVETELPPERSLITVLDCGQHHVVAGNLAAVGVLSEGDLVPLAWARQRPRWGGNPIAFVDSGPPRGCPWSGMASMFPEALTESSSDPPLGSEGEWCLNRGEGRWREIFVVSRNPTAGGEGDSV